MRLGSNRLKSQGHFGVRSNPVEFSPPSRPLDVDTPIPRTNAGDDLDGRILGPITRARTNLAGRPDVVPIGRAEDSSNSMGIPRRSRQSHAKTGSPAAI